MQLIALDFETMYSNEYTLRKQTVESYIRDPRFEALLIGWATPDGKSGYVEQSALPAFLADVVPGAGVVMHHAHFDGLILSHHFGVKPAFIFDTLSMGRQLHGTSLGLSLASLAEHYNLSPKTVPYDRFIGRRWTELDAETRVMLGNGAAHDCALTMEIFRQMLPRFPKEELLIVDTTVRMFSEPCLIGDAALFAELRDEEFLKKNELLYALDVGEKDLASADKFCAILEREGVEIEYKAGKNGDIPAIAASDQFMRDMAAGVYGETVAFLAEARLNVKSTIAETRCGRLHEMSRRGPLPVYLNYCGCHTTRWSGGDKSNMQNMPRGSRMRTGVKAPDGFLLCPTDQEQGECRVVNWLAGQWDVVQRFANGEDVYLPMASSFYGRPITKADKKERQVGKTLELMGGFGGGAAKIGATLKIAGVILTPEEQERAKNTYRGDHPRVVAYWAEARELLPRLANEERFTWGPFEGRDGKIILPNGGWIDYSSLSWEEDEKTGKHEWRLRSRRGWTKAYGAKLVENVVQALSRVITSQAMIKVRNAGYHIVMSSHDDFVPLVPIDGHEEEARLFFEACMSETPAWAPGLPLAASGKLGATYD